MKKILLVCLSIICLVGCDYTSKNIAKAELKDMSVHSYLGGHLQFIYAENPGGFLSTGSQLSENTRLIIYKYFVSIIMLFLFAYTIFKKGLKKLPTAALVFIMSGGIGNLIDRFMNDGKVVDFIMMSIFNFHTGILNLADVYVMIGVTLIIISTIFSKYQSARSDIIK